MPWLPMVKPFNIIQENNYWVIVSYVVELARFIAWLGAKEIVDFVVLDVSG